RLRQIPAICRNGVLLWWVSTLVDTAVHGVRSIFRRKTDLTPETKKSPVDPHRPGIWIATLPRLGEAVPP
ncbi:TPA: hypothetical protein ACOD9T_003392, partial [Stenotrophomonas maltophilia]